MNKPLTAIETIVAVPVMSKREKLMRLAALVRSFGYSLYMFNGLEYRTARELETMVHPFSAFALAAKDPILQDAGLQGDSVADAKRFFELSNDELHAFSCDCGGHLSNGAMARRIETIAST